MNFLLRLGILVVLFLLIGHSAGAQESSGLTITNPAVAPDMVYPGNKVLISCNIEHVSGRNAILRVAVTFLNDTSVITYPRLHDDGTHGDTIEGDSIFSLKVNAPTDSGPYKIIVSAVDKNGQEVESDPVILTIR